MFMAVILLWKSDFSGDKASSERNACFGAKYFFYNGMQMMARSSIGFYESYKLSFEVYPCSEGAAYLAII